MKIIFSLFISLIEEWKDKFIFQIFARNLSIVCSFLFPLQIHPVFLSLVWFVSRSVVFNVTTLSACHQLLSKNFSFFSLDFSCYHLKIIIIMKCMFFGNYLISLNQNNENINDQIINLLIRVRLIRCVHWKTKRQLFDFF